MSSKDVDDMHVDDLEVVERAIRAVGDLDIEAARRWLADGLVLELPYRGGGQQRTLVGADAHRFMAALPKLFTRMNFTNVVVHGTTTPGLFVAEYSSDGLTVSGHPYPNVYAAFLEVDGGRIVRWREYFNPEVISAAGLG